MNLLIHINVVTRDKPHHVMAYCICSFLIEILVWPPIGPPGTDEAAVASRKTGSVFNWSDMTLKFLFW